ncbi:MAG TPA: NAD(P)-binding protein [Gemmatimonadaceae bacterium]|nr:NAD(P)-binding protein [Gemmatimonadaceae bacterium]
MKSDDEIGFGAPITRKDFLNTTLLGAGVALISAVAPADARTALPADKDDFTGYGGVGDYAASNGNTKAVVDAAHRLRDGAYKKGFTNVTDTGETFDLVIVGGGLSGLSAAYTYVKSTGGAKRCLILDNHAIFGGEAKENEFVVNGVRLIAPQGSNQFGPPAAGSPSDALWSDLRMPREFRYQPLDPSVDPLRVPMDNYAHMDGVNEFQVDIGYFFDRKSGATRPTWLRNIWQNDLADAPFTPEVKADLLKWRSASPPQRSEAFLRSLDAVTYKDYLEKTLGFRPEVTKYIEPVVGLINGASPDAVSAFASQQIGMPAVSRARGRTGALPRSFPGGNSTYARHYVKYLIPDAIAGDATFEGILNGRTNLSALDRAGQPTRIRTGAMVLRVEHDGHAASAERVVIHYAAGGRVYRTYARRVVMASGGWINKHVIGDLPTDMRAAYDTFAYAPALVVNVALTNWRFLYKLGAPSVRWFGDGFGFSANIRRPMLAGEYHPPLHPDQPTVLTFYMGLYAPGHPAAEQGILSRTKMLATSYADYERTIRQHMTRLFADAGFDARRDIAGIILNRWGHARMVQPPGWYYGTAGKPPAREIIQKGFGRIAIGHSELNGHQSATGAIAQGERAARASE